MSRWFVLPAVIACAFVLAANPAPAQSGPGTTLVAALAEQLPIVAGIAPRARGRDLSLAALRGLVETASADERFGLELVLQAEHFGPLIREGLVVHDDSGDAPSSAQDIGSAVFSEQPGDRLEVEFATRSSADAGTTVQLCVDVFGDGDYDYGVGAYRTADGSWTLFAQAFEDGSARPIDVDFSFTAGLGYRVSLDYGDLPTPPEPDRPVRAGVQAWRSGRTGFDETPVATLGYAVNYALVLFLHLLETVPGIELRLAAALALANNNIYAAADVPTRDAILADMARHAGFYEELSVWQHETRTAYRLDDLPVVALTLWADRVRTEEYLSDGRLSLDEYREFVDSIDAYERIRRMAMEAGLYSRSMSQTAMRLEEYVVANQLYRASVAAYDEWHGLGTIDDDQWRSIRAEFSREVFALPHFGRVRAPDQNAWLNRQLSLWDEMGYFIGDCGTSTTMQLAFYRAAGIAPVSCQYYNAHDSMAYTHNFPCYYDPTRRLWTAYQRPRDSGTPLYLHLSKPQWHHALATYDWQVQGDAISCYTYPGERGTDSEIRRLLDTGITEEHFRELFLGSGGLKPGTFFGPGRGAAPRRPLDRDGDGISDAVELDYGLDPTAARSPDARRGASLVGEVTSRGGLSVGASPTLVPRLSLPRDEAALGSVLNTGLVVGRDAFLRGRFEVALVDASVRPGPLVVDVDLPAVGRLGVNLSTEAGTSLTGYTLVHHSPDGVRISVDPPPGRYRLGIYRIVGDAWTWQGELRFDVLRAAELPQSDGFAIRAPYPVWTGEGFDGAPISMDPAAGILELTSGEVVLDFVGATDDELAFSLMQGERWLEGFVRWERRDGGYRVWVGAPAAGEYRLFASLVEAGSWQAISEYRLYAPRGVELPRVGGGSRATSPYPILTADAIAAGVEYVGPVPGSVLLGPRGYSFSVRAPQRVELWHGLYRVRPTGWTLVEGASTGSREGEDLTIRVDGAGVPEPGRYAATFSFFTGGEWLYGGCVYVDVE